MVRDLKSDGPDWQTAVQRGTRDGWKLALLRLHQPAFDGSEVLLGQAAMWIDPMQQSRAVVMSRYPLLIGVGDLVVDPDEGAFLRPFDEPTGLPVNLFHRS
ncbi:hypothetical protein [Micromonospora sp. KC207]|uniref:hypothetical protein n=1 Tax=Micromonospora sp. KC207 TaxID=2530377 RepID=UPI0014045BB0|nr:hypothetical protein [Micromonospora sp. KC207]